MFGAVLVFGQIRLLKQLDKLKPVILSKIYKISLVCVVCHMVFIVIGLNEAVFWDTWKIIDIYAKKKWA